MNSIYANCHPIFCVREVCHLSFFLGGCFLFTPSFWQKIYQESECHKKIVAGSRKPSCVKWMDGKGDFQACPNSRLGFYVAIERTIYKQMIF